MKEIVVTRCELCPFYLGHELAHLAECWLDTDVIPKQDKVPTACPMRHGEVLVCLAAPQKRQEVGDV